MCVMDNDKSQCKIINNLLFNPLTFAMLNFFVKILETKGVI